MGFLESTLLLDKTTLHLCVRLGTVTIPANLVANTAEDRNRDFIPMNPTLFIGSKSVEDTQEFLDIVQMVTVIMGVTSSKSVYLASY